ncbi:hypothetical protein PMAYCL1PPCAC_22196 [Pristionchus mayeri]|uniref:Uncharacterized protein n=1 Tax=Pristionchus mayeri TaxID=1317129 RepID=A0AAN5CWJ0_9BILA|nr:hypothetical protein PMAYCL1PPCAC_22196 [Pristionchus mayeri]
MSLTAVQNSVTCKSTPALASAPCSRLAEIQVATTVARALAVLSKPAHSTSRVAAVRETYAMNLSKRSSKENLYPSSHRSLNKLLVQRDQQQHEQPNKLRNQPQNQRLRVVLLIRSLYLLYPLHQSPLLPLIRSIKRPLIVVPIVQINVYRIGRHLSHDNGHKSYFLPFPIVIL